MALRQASLLGTRAGAALRRDATSAHRRRKAKNAHGNPANNLKLWGSSRDFHPSGRSEMLPIIGGALAVAAVATGLRYLVRAGKRMKDIEEEEKKSGRAKGGGGGGDEDPAPSDGPAFGVDVGVTNLRLAFADSAGMRPEVIENREGSRWTPACVSFKGGDPVIGTIARAQRFEAADSTLVGMQPLLGMPFSDASARSVAASAGVLSSGDLEEGEGGMAGRRVGQDGKVMTAQDVLGLMLGNMRDLGEHKIKAGGAAVLSCPAYFDEAQRGALLVAGEAAGVTVLDVLDEPVAAVLAAQDLSVLTGDPSNGLIAVLDVGGRSAQCSIVDAGIQGERPKLVGCDWTIETGGDQWDAGIVDLLDEEFQKANGGFSLKGDAMALTRLFDAATAARVELTRVQQAHVNIPYITADQTGPKHLDVILTRARVDRIIEPLLRKAEDPCAGALKMAQVDTSALSAVLVVGGCCRTPALQDLAGKIFEKAGGGGGNSVVSTPEQSEEMVVLGAALEARHIVYGDETD